MRQPYAHAHTVHLPTGTLTLRTDSPNLLHELCDFAARANPKRGFLIVSKVLGRHLPARPAAMRTTMARMAETLEPAFLPGPVLFFGMAETATALGQGIFEAWQGMTGRQDAFYLQSTRCSIANDPPKGKSAPGMTLAATFEEGHSHASTHLIHLGDENIRKLAREARAIVIVDDECSTGNTFVEAATALRKIAPNAGKIHCLSITDWSDRQWLGRMPIAAQAHSLLRGSLQWEPNLEAPTFLLPIRANARGNAPDTGMRARTGITKPERPLFPWGHDPLPLIGEITPGERATVLGDGEHAYAALQIAESIEAAGGIAAVQAITRSPALPGHAIGSISQFSDSTGSGAPCFAYNLVRHGPARVIVAAETLKAQARELADALERLSHKAQVHAIECHYGSRAAQIEAIAHAS